MRLPVRNKSHLFSVHFSPPVSVRRHKLQRYEPGSVIPLHSLAGNSVSMNYVALRLVITLQSPAILQTRLGKMASRQAGTQRPWICIRYVMWELSKLSEMQSLFKSLVKVIHVALCIIQQYMTLSHLFTLTQSNNSEFYTSCLTEEIKLSYCALLAETMIPSYVIRPVTTITSVQS